MILYYALVFLRRLLSHSTSTYNDLAMLVQVFLASGFWWAGWLYPLHHPLIHDSTSDPVIDGLQLTLVCFLKKLLTNVSWALSTGYAQDDPFFLSTIRASERLLNLHCTSWITYERWNTADNYFNMLWRMINPFNCEDVEVVAFANIELQIWQSLLIGVSFGTISREQFLLDSLLSCYMLFLLAKKESRGVGK